MYRSPCPVGTKIQQRSGRIVVKIETEKGTLRWEALARRVWEDQRGKLKEGERVFLIRGVGSEINITNLCVVRFRTEKFRVLAHSKVLYMPDIHVIDRKSGKVLLNS